MFEVLVIGQNFEKYCTSTAAKMSLKKTPLGILGIFLQSVFIDR